ncbi:MAG: aminopeptidase [Bacteroidales bacterium]|nr:aminopeptidase [Candidatus Minthousia equi]
MNKSLFLTLAAAVVMSSNVFAADKKKPKEQPKEEGFVFTTVKEAPITSVKNQASSGTCWAYSALGFIEAELIRQGKGEYDLCEMFLAHKTYQDRAMAAVRTHGDVSYSQGGSFYDAVFCLKNYGMCPQEAMPAPGSPYGAKNNEFSELFNITTGYVEGIAKGKQRKLSPIWNKGFISILDSYLGETPEKFSYKGKEYTPKSFVDSWGINLNDFVSLTSFTHRPFYEPLIIEVQDNWRWAGSYNLPLDEFMAVMENAVNNGYTFAWGADVSEQGFTRDGVAVCPDVAKAQEIGSDQARWVGGNVQDRRAALTSKPMPEITVTPELRQAAYDNWETTDDHGMLIYGIAKDQDGKEYFMVKNSWGETGKYKGSWYAAKAFVAYKTLNILGHKDAIPAHIAKKIGLK